MDWLLSFNCTGEKKGVETIQKLLVKFTITKKQQVTQWIECNILK